MLEKKGIKKQVTGKIKESFELGKTDKGLTVTAHKIFIDDDEDNKEIDRPKPSFQ